MSLPDFIGAAASLLKAKGRLCMIYHPSRLSELIDVSRRRDLEPKKLRFVHSTISSEAKMVLMEAVKGGRGGLVVDKPLCIYGEDGRYRAEMKSIYKV